MDKQYDEMIEALTKARDLAEAHGNEELISATENALICAHKVAFTDWRKSAYSPQIEQEATWAA